MSDFTRRVIAAIEPETRVLALTWVSSSTGLKIPVREICREVRKLNRKRKQEDRVLTVVDGVHAFGIDDFTFDELGCDFFVTGCHKWLFGPRGTGLICGRADAWPWVTPTIPRFRGGGGPGKLHSPGGIHSYAARWALAEAFELHLDLGKADVQARTRRLASALKKGLAAIPGVTVATPVSTDFSAGIVSCAIDGMTAREAETALARSHSIRSSEGHPDGPGGPTYVRLSPSVLNSYREVKRTVRAVKSLTA